MRHDTAVQTREFSAVASNPETAGRTPQTVGAANGVCPATLSPPATLPETRAGQLVAPSGAALSYLIECPCCGTTVSRKAPVIDLTTNVISWRGIVRLSPQSAILAHVMGAEFGEWHHRDDLLTKLYGHRDLDGPLRSFSDEMTRLRRKVRPISLLIETTRNRRAVASYRMVSL